MRAGQYPQRVFKNPLLPTSSRTTEVLRTLGWSQSLVCRERRATGDFAGYTGDERTFTSNELKGSTTTRFRPPSHPQSFCAYDRTVCGVRSVIGLNAPARRMSPINIRHYAIAPSNMRLARGERREMRLVLSYARYQQRLRYSRFQL